MVEQKRGILPMARDVLESLTKKPVTVLYPFDRVPVPRRSRGKLAYKRSLCTKCGLCVRFCPSTAITMAEKGVVFDLGRCTFCASCVRICPMKAIKQLRVFEMATTKRDDLFVK